MDTERVAGQERGTWAEVAAKAFHRGCMAGEGRACALLGEAYGAGRGVEKSAHVARMFNGKGCELGDGRACATWG